jgi:hypothetical protein
VLLERAEDDCGGPEIQRLASGVIGGILEHYIAQDCWAPRAKKTGSVYSCEAEFLQRVLALVTGPQTKSIK